MDPVTAFGIVTGIFQVLQFGREATKSCLEVYKQGASTENLSIEKSTTYLANANLRLRNILHEATTGGKVPNNDDVHLQALARECAGTAQELLELLEQLRPRESAKYPRVESFKKGFSALWQKDEVRRLERQLEKLKGIMDTEVLNRLSERFDILRLQQSDAFEQLDEKSQSILASIAASKDDIAATVLSEHVETRRSTTSGILDLRDQYVSDREHQELLDSLFFPAIYTRQEDISETHRKTFEWIFKPNASKQWHDFPTWLAHGNDLYWIKGKPGSGKSTLMKFISEDRRTEAALHQWARKRELFMPSFFFWNAGTAEQKSVNGMLKSILYQVLEAFPTSSAALSDSRQGFRPSQTTLWTTKRLLTALESVVSQNYLPLKLCFVLDGLDEAEDHDALLEFLERFSKNEHIKFVISSRPLRTFELAFRNSASLQLHDLTFQDISTFAMDRLNGHEHFEVLKESDPVRAQELISLVVNKAEGVFLWVVLAVRQLRTGLDNEDSIEQLLERLAMLPGEIEDLYSVLLDSFEKLYYQEAVRFFNLMLTYRGGDMHLLDFALVEGEPINAPLFGRTGGLTASEFFTKVDSLIVKILTRCKGLLEIRDTRVSRQYRQTFIDNFAARYSGHTLDVKLRRYFYRHINVRWLHKTVPDFLQSTEKGRAFMGAGSDSRIRAYDDHIRIQLCRIRLASPTFLETPHDTRHVENVMFYLVKAEMESGSANVKLIDNVDRTIRHIADLSGVAPTPHWSARLALVTDFLGLAATHGLFLFFREKLKVEGDSLTQDRASYLLKCVILRHWAFERQALYCQVLTELLGHGANPNVSSDFPGKDPNSTPWTLFLDYTWRIHSSKKSPRGAWIEAAIAFVKAGAEVDLILPHGAKDRYRIGAYALELDSSTLSILQYHLGRGPNFEKLEKLVLDKGGEIKSRARRIYVAKNLKGGGSYDIQTERQSDAVVAAWHSEDGLGPRITGRAGKKACDPSTAFAQVVRDILKELETSPTTLEDDGDTASVVSDRHVTTSDEV